jgi:hypothetical protein
VIAAAALHATLAAASVAAAPAQASLTASPTHVALSAGGRQVVRVGTIGRGSLSVDARVAGFALDLGGRPRIVSASDAAPWLSVRPRRLTIGHNGGLLTVSSRRPLHARPGDHSAVVLLSAVAPSARGVVVRMRIGLAVSVRIAGRVVHRVSVVAARIRRTGRARQLELVLANRGNVIETVGAGGLSVSLLRRGRVVAHYLVARRELLPGTRGLVRLRYDGHARGMTVVRTELRRAGARAVERRFRLRL